MWVKKKVLHKTCMFTMLNLFCHQGSIWRVAYNMRKFPHQLTLTTTLGLRISFSVPSWDTRKHQNIILLNLPLKQFSSYFINGQRLLSHLLLTCAKFGIFFSITSFSDYSDLPGLSKKIYILLSIFLSPWKSLYGHQAFFGAAILWLCDSEKHIEFTACYIQYFPITIKGTSGHPF